MSLKLNTVYSTLCHVFFHSGQRYSFLYTVFDAISTGVDMVFSINPSANLFVIVSDFSVH